MPEYRTDRPADRAEPWPMRSRARKAPSIQKTVSTAKAMGLMQVTPAAGQIRRQEIQRDL